MNWFGRLHWAHSNIEETGYSQVEFENQIVGTAIPATYISSIEKGFREACNSGALIGYPVEVRCRLAFLAGKMFK